MTINSDALTGGSLVDGLMALLFSSIILFRNSYTDFFIIVNMFSKYELKLILIVFYFICNFKEILIKQTCS